MKAPFQFPLLAGDLAIFCHPADKDLAHPFTIDGDVIAANRYLALRAYRGRWLTSDFPQPSEATAQRILSLPWGTFPDQQSAEWRDLDDVRGILYSYPLLPIWTENRLTPSPIARISGLHLVRLSFLQQLARLPRAALYCADVSAGSPLYVRWNGGIGIIPKDKKLTISSLNIFKPQRLVNGTGRVTRSNPLPNMIDRRDPMPPEQPIDNWPPPAPVD